MVTRAPFLTLLKCDADSLADVNAYASVAALATRVAWNIEVDPMSNPQPTP